MSSETGQTDVQIADQQRKKLIDKLRAVCGMLGSKFENERANAADMATGLLAKLGLSWGSLVDEAFRKIDQAKRAPTQSPFPSSYPSPGAGWQAFRHQWGQRAAQAQQSDFFGQQPPGGPTRNPYSAGPRPSAGRTTAKRRHGLLLWDVIKYAHARLDRLDTWEQQFVISRYGMGEGQEGTDAVWATVIALATKLNIRHVA